MINVTHRTRTLYLHDIFKVDTILRLILLLNFVFYGMIIYKVINLINGDR